MKFDLGFGNSVCVRKAFIETYNGVSVYFNKSNLSQFDYPNEFGDPELIEITRKVIKRQTGQEYNHVYLTNGATGAITIGLRSFRQAGYEYCHTRKAPWYLRYPCMIKSADLIHKDEEDKINTRESVVLLDIPSNPLGITKPIDFYLGPTIIDGVYLNKVYSSDILIPIPAHEIMAGSYSKLLGLNGLRVGWIATKDGIIAERIKELIVGEYCGISMSSTNILKATLENFEWEKFEIVAKKYIDYNREEFSKLENFFGQTKVPSNGNFYYVPIDKKAKELLIKSKINWTKGSQMGTSDNFARFNIGQDCEMIRKAVKEFISNDKRSK